MTIEDALPFFSAVPTVAPKLQTPMDVGLSYVRLGQSALKPPTNTLRAERFNRVALHSGPAMSGAWRVPRAPSSIPSRCSCSAVPGRPGKHWHQI
jgi:hypothetical protein